MDEGELNIYKNSNASNESSSPNGEHIAVLRSLVSVYERRLKRFQEEHKLLSELTEIQYGLINKMGITPTNMILSPVENQQSDNGTLKNTPDNLNNVKDNSPNNENENDQQKTNSPSQYDEFSDSSLNTQNFLAFLQNEMKQKIKNHSLNEIFLKFPIFESAFFNKNFSFDIQPICEYVQTLNQEKRQEFYSEIWSSLNNLPYFFNSLFSLIETNSFHFLSDLVETTLPHSLNYTHVLLYLYDSKKSLLTIEKQKVKIDHILKDGLISNAIKSNKPVFIDRNDPKIKFDDLSIMVKHEKALFIPIAETSIVLAFFDKIGKFTPLDNLIAYSLSSIINEITHGLQIQVRMKDSVSTYQQMGNIFIELTSICNITDLLNIMETSLTKVFNCSKLCFFEVSEPSQTFWRFDTYNNGPSNPIRFQIGHGIIGYSISKKSTITLSRPEFSILFDSDSDIPEKGAKIDSILSCPVFDEKNEVKWSIVLYNKSNSDNFSQEDISSIEIFTRHLHPIIETALKTGKISSKKKSIEDLDRTSDFLTSLSNLDINDIKSQIAKEMQEIAPITKTEIYSVDERANIIFLMNKDEISIKKYEENSDDPIVKFALKNEMKETKTKQSKKFFCPLIGSSEKVVGMMVMTSSSSEMNSKTFSKLQKKLSFFNESQGPCFVPVSDSRMSEKLTSLSRIVGQLVEILNENERVKKMILIRERIVDSLSTFDARTIAYLYPQIELNFIVERKKQEEETKPFSCFIQNDDLLKNYISLISFLNRFPGNCNLLTMKRSNMSKIEDLVSIESIENEFTFSNLFDVFALNEKKIFDSLFFLLQEIGIVSYFKFDKIQIRSCIDIIRKLHLNKKFSNWQLSIDRIQFLNYFLRLTNLHKKFTECQKLALFFYLISMNCDPFVDSFIKSKFFLEFRSSFNVGTSIFVILSSIPDSSFFLISKEEQNSFFKNIESLEQIKNFDSSFSDDLFVLTALICSFSYLARDFVVSKKWIKMRFEEEINEDENEFVDELIKYQLEFEMSVLIQPAFNEFETNNCKIDDIRNMFNENLNKLTS